MARPSRRDRLKSFLITQAEKSQPNEIPTYYTNPPYHELFEALGVTTDRIKLIYEPLIPQILQELIEESVIVKRVDYKGRWVYRLPESGETKVVAPALFANAALSSIREYIQIENEDPAAAAVRTRLLKYIFEGEEDSMLFLIRSVESRLIALKRTIEYIDLIRETADKVLHTEDLHAIKRYIKTNHDPEAYF